MKNIRLYIVLIIAATVITMCISSIHAVNVRSRTLVVSEMGTYKVGNKYYTFYERGGFVEIIVKDSVRTTVFDTKALPIAERELYRNPSVYSKWVSCIMSDSGIVFHSSDVGFSVIKYTKYDFHMEKIDVSKPFIDSLPAEFLRKLPSVVKKMYNIDKYK